MGWPTPCAPGVPLPNGVPGGFDCGCGWGDLCTLGDTDPGRPARIEAAPKSQKPAERRRRLTDGDA